MACTRREARDPRRRRGCRRDRGLLERVSALARRAWPRRRAAGRLGRHEGLKNAIAKVLGCPWQRCTVHFLRDCLGHAQRDQHGPLAALIRPIFQADSAGQARDRLAEAVAHLDGKLPKAAALLEQAVAPVRASLNSRPP
jgi:hypothetical protein